MLVYMVVSLLNNNVTYKENKDIDEDDLSKDVEPFLIDLKDIYVIGGIGNEKYTYVQNGIVIIPLYLFFNDRVVGKVGYYEVTASKLSDMLDEEGNLDVDRLNDPIVIFICNKRVLN